MMMVEEQKNGVKASMPVSETMLVAINGGSRRTVTGDDELNQEKEGEVATKLIDVVKQPPPMSSEDSGRYLDQMSASSSDVNIESMSNSEKQNAVWPSGGEETTHHNNNEILTTEAIEEAERMYKPKPQSTSSPHQRSESPLLLDDEPLPPPYQNVQSTTVQGRRRTAEVYYGYGHPSLHKSSSMPSLAALEKSNNNNNNNDNDDDKSSPPLSNSNNNKSTPNYNESVTRGRIYPWQHKDFGRPLMSERRRSLSPMVSSFQRHGFGRPPPSRLTENNDTLFYMSLIPGMSSHDYNNESTTTSRRIYPYDIPGTGLDTSDKHDVVNTHNHLNSYYTQSKHHGSRRTSLPEHLEQALRNDGGRSQSEVMDPNAMRYLPKILRDTYAQRQTKRRSSVSIHFLLCLRGGFFLQINGKNDGHAMCTESQNTNLFSIPFFFSLIHTTSSLGRHN